MPRRKRPVLTAEQKRQKPFARQLRNCMNAFNVSNVELAKELDISPQMVTNYKSGENDPDIYTVLELSKIFKVSCDVLIGKESGAMENDEVIRIAEYIGLPISWVKELHEVEKSKQRITSQGDFSAEMFSFELIELFSNFIQRIAKSEIQSHDPRYIDNVLSLLRSEEDKGNG